MSASPKIPGTPQMNRRISVMNPDLELIISPSKLIEKTSFVGRMKKMHEFNVD